VAIAELGIPGVQRGALPATFPADCRSDLLTVDGTPLPVRIVGDTAPAAAGGTLQVQRCDPTGAAPTPLGLAAGVHELRATPASITGINLDGLVLASGAGGGPVALDTPVAAIALPTGAAPRVVVTSNRETTIHAQVRHATSPFWLVLGQSFNNGWHATVNGRDLGTPQLVDGMSNGWRVTPSQGRPLAITLTWTPQNRIWIALVISGLTMLVCGLLALRRPRRWSMAGGAADGPLTLASPLTSAGPTLPRRVVVSTTATATLASALIVTPWVGLVVGGATLAVLLRPRLRWLLTIGAPTALAVAGGYVFVQQWRHMYPSVFEWPTFFDGVHAVAWLAVVLLAADAVVELIRSRRLDGRTDGDA
jgi:arabinofuranan 3-O-arabinosyltransferase